MKERLKKLGASLLRIAAALALVLGIPVVLYLCWSPGKLNVEGRFDWGRNAIWIGHGWLGDDPWFQRYGRNTADFRDEAKIDALLKNLQDNHIKYVYPHLCPAQPGGAIAASDPAQVERFLDAAEKYGIQVIPWIGGVLDESARINESEWRRSFVASVAQLLEKHPRLAGVQVNIEPLPSGNTDFLRLLDELRPALDGRILGVAAYPPPTHWHPFPNVHWELDYITEVAKRSDQMAVMMYDTAIKLEKFYISLMKKWTQELHVATAGTKCRLLLGLPAYEDAGVGYHHPSVEHLKAAIGGIQAASPEGNYIGCAIYCEWEMTPEKWAVWRTAFLNQPSQ